MPAQQPPHVDATFYAQIDPKWSDWRSDPSGHPVIDSARAVALTQKRPEKQRPGTVLVKLTVRIPTAAFLPLRPEAVVVVPESLTSVAPIEVVAGDASEVEA